MIALTLHALVILGLVAGIAWVIRWAFQQAPLCGAVILVGVSIRIIAGSTLFAISWWHLPVLRSLQTEPGFWILAQDSPNYFRLANIVTAQGPSAIRWDAGSPVYVVILSLWMRLVGSTPAAGFMLNGVAYVALCGLLVALFARRRPEHGACLFAIASITFSPVLLLHGTQTLKDELFVGLTFLAFIGLAAILAGLIPSELSRSRVGTATGWLTAMLCLPLITGIRSYYALALWAMMAFALAVGVAIQPLGRLPKYAVQSCAVLATLWVAYSAMDGNIAGIAPGRHGWSVASIVEVPTRLMLSAVTKRVDFIRSGGGTSLVVSNGQEQVSLDEASPQVLWPHLSSIKTIARGATALVVPMTLLRAVGVYDFSGGRGLVGFVDLDTIYIDVVTAMALWLVMTQGGAARGNRPLVLATLVLCCVIGVLLAYVVTNFGTLFRLRMLAVAPLWILPALCRQPVTTSLTDSPT